MRGLRPSIHLDSRPLTLRLNEVAFGGRGVGRGEEAGSDGRAVFVPFVIAGETVRAETVREHRGHVDARLIEVVEPSPARLPGPAPCPYFGRCGGCAYQHMRPEEQLATKARQVAGVLRRVGKLELAPGVLRPIVASPADYGYRNRITVHARDGVIGFFSHPWDDPAGRRTLLDITHCPISAPGVNDALADLRRRQRASSSSRGGGRASREEPERHFTLRGPEHRDRRFFQQTNDGAALRLLDVVRDHLAGNDVPRGHLIDAYAGAGFFARALAGSFARVTGLEWDRHAVAAAREGAAAHERYLAGDVAALLPGALAEAAAAETVVVLDPPAEGVSREVIAALRAGPPAALVYVSCDPATLARDLARLLAVAGEGEAPAWELRAVTPLDMFPQTAEIETVAFLQRAVARRG